MTPPRSFSVFTIVFAVVFAVVYVVCVEKNYALFTYHPALAEFGAGVQAPREGPAMYWYGWLATSTLAAVLAGTLASALPARLVGRLWPGFAWTVPVAAMAIFCYLLRNFFLR